MTLPGSEADVEAVLVQFNAVAFINAACEAIAQLPDAIVQILPRQMDPALSRGAAQIHHDDRPLFTALPAPGGEIAATRIIRPPGAVAEAPCAFMEQRIGDRLQQSFIEGSQLRIGKFFRTPAQKDRWADSAPFKLSLAKEPGSGQGRGGERVRLFFIAGEGGAARGSS